MENKRKARIRQERGITLMALIITIIVLVILATITIGTVYTLGIIQMGTQGAKNYANSAIKENEILNETTAYVEDVVKNIKRRLGEWEYFEKKDTINGAKGDSNNPTIPAGFRPINTDKAKWGDGEREPSAEAVNNGLVIEDRDGNQFVWVPCYVSEPSVKEAKYPEYKQYTYKGADTNDVNINLVDDNRWRTWYYRNYHDWEDTAADDYGNTSITQYGGFWIGRYEAGIPEDATFYPEGDDGDYISVKDTKNVSTKEETELKPVSKAGYFSWNFIDQTTSITVSEQMYENRDDIESHLIDSYAWDTVMKWFETSEQDRSYVTDSTTKGNYITHEGNYTGRYAPHIWCSNKQGGTSGWIYATKLKSGTIPYKYQRKGADYASSGDFTWDPTFTDEKNYFDTRLETPTGVNNEFAVKNIYDMGGNMFEWTTETGAHDLKRTYVCCFASVVHFLLMVEKILRASAMAIILLLILM